MGGPLTPTTQKVLRYVPHRAVPEQAAAGVAALKWQSRLLILDTKMAVRTPSAMDGNTSPISPTALAGLDSPSMSRHTTPSAPASEFGNLALGSSSSGSSVRRMAPVTRSASRRGGTGSQIPSTRPTAGSSRRSQVQAGAGSSRRQGSQRPAPDDDDDDSSDDDSSEEDDEDERNRARAELLRRQRCVNIYDLFALSDPDYLTGQEIMSATNRSANACVVSSPISGSY